MIGHDKGLEFRVLDLELSFERPFFLGLIGRLW
jgi:hypothetical protein